MAATASATMTPSSSLQATAGGPGSRSRPDGKALKRALNDHDDLDHQALWRVRLGQAGERSLALRFLSVRLISEGAPGERRDGTCRRRSVRCRCHTEPVEKLTQRGRRPTSA